LVWGGRPHQRKKSHQEGKQPCIANTGRHALLIRLPPLYPWKMLGLGKAPLAEDGPRCAAWGLRGGSKVRRRGKRKKIFLYETEDLLSERSLGEATVNS